MKRFNCFLLYCLTFGSVPPALAAGEPAVAPAGTLINFTKDIKPLLEASCVQCHAKGKIKAGFSVETREAFIKGGDSGPAAVAGKGSASLVVKLVSGGDPDSIMPKKGTRWTPAQIALLTAWIDQGMKWDDGVTFAKPEPNNLKPKSIELPQGKEKPADRLLSAYFESTKQKLPPIVDDRTFARRVWLDAIGLLPPSPELEAFVSSKAKDKREKLVAKLLSDQYGYADHWLTFWNDLLRNDYKGTGFIDGGRKQITGWLYSALLANKPYDQFVRELVAPPTTDAEGFTKGIVWRGTVPASMTPPMQAAQSISQVFLGINLKCASCHDSFVSDWTLADAYGLAALYSDKPLEMVRCDKPTGKTADPRFLYPEIGAIDPKLPKGERLKRFGQLMTSQNNGRLSRAIVNRVWTRLLGRGLVEPVDDMDKPAWSPALLDWLAEDFVASGYDLRHLIERIMTSRAYQLPPIDAPSETSKETYVFRGPFARRLTAEQFADAMNTLSGDWARLPASVDVDFTAGGKIGTIKPPAWVWTPEPVTMGVQRLAWQVAGAKADAAQKQMAEAQKQVAAGAPTAADAAAKARLAFEQASVFVAEAESVTRSTERAAEVAAAPEKLDPALLPLARHKVVFRKVFKLDALPDGDVFAAVAGSQRTELLVNGKTVGPTVGDTKGGRTGLFDLRPHLVKGDNLITLVVDSHTERPNLQPTDREKYPAVYDHLNERNGVTFAASFTAGGKPNDWATDDTWLSRRAPETGFTAVKFEDKDWLKAAKLPAGVTPADEGPAIDNLGRRPTDKPMLELGPKLPGLVALTTRIGKIRTALQMADPLQLALGRPNREMVTTSRQTAATTIQALELTNGGSLDARLKRASLKLTADAAKDPAKWIDSLYRQTLCRPPTASELAVAAEVVGKTPSPETVADVLWAILMQPEFQYVH